MSRKKAVARRAADPFYGREAAKYENPLPSREYILQLLTEAARPLPPEELQKELAILPEENEAFFRRLEAMARAGQLLFNRKGELILPERASLIPGRIEGHPDGFGFLIPDDGSADIYLDQHQMKKALHRDKVLARVGSIDRKGRREGKIVEVTHHANQTVVGRLLIDHGVWMVIPENRRISQDVMLQPLQGKKIKVNAGQVVVVDMVEPPGAYTPPIGRLREVLGNHGDPGMEIEIALRKHALPFEFSKDVLSESKKIPDQVSKTDWADREDLRDFPFVTIDGETAKDFDDAVYAEKKGRGFRLLVAIADVSHYVLPGTALDAEAFDRGTSVYFPRRVIPMLPENLSNGICSLNPDVERLALVCDMTVNAQGELGKYRFYPAIFQSRARLTYTEVWALIEGKKTAAIAEERRAELENLYALYQKLHKAREARGAIDFETRETQMLFDKGGKISQIVPLIRNTAHRLIEECMLAANVCAADFLEKHKHPALYRVHAAPSEEKLSGLRVFLAEFGLALSGGDDPTAADYANLIEKIKPRPDFQLLQTVLLRSMKRAVYAPDNIGHFGLAYPHYAHFTSPIRRYPDLLVHRAIKAALTKKTYRPVNTWDILGQHTSATERRADEASRDVESWLKCHFMQEKVGSIFSGTIAAVTAFGIFVALDDIDIEGLVHVTELGADYFQFDAQRHQMLGERTGKRFRLGDRLRVRVVRADLDSQKIDFVLALPDVATKSLKKTLR